MSNKKKRYIEPKDFFREMLLAIKNDHMSDRLANMFMLLAERYVNHPNFVRYGHLREDFISIGCVACCKSWKKFKPLKVTESSVDDNDIDYYRDTLEAWENNFTIFEYNYRICNNPFAFFTTCIRNDILQFLKHEYNQRNIYNKIKVDIGLDPEYGYIDMLKEQEERDNDESSGLAEDEVRNESDDDDETKEEETDGVIW